MSLPIFDRLYSDIVERGGIHTIGTKQTGKSNLKKSLTEYVIRNHPETKTIIIDPEGSWEFNFSKVRFYRIPKKSMRIREEPMGRRLNGTIFTRKVYKLDKTLKSDVLRLLKDKEPILFIVELDDPEEIGYFSAFIIEQIYDMQRIKRKYWKGKLKKSYFITLEESENIFSSYTLEKNIFQKLSKKYSEMANLRIGILSSSQRLTEVSKKFRAKMNGYLIGFLLEDEYIGHIQRMLRIKLGRDAKQVTDPSFRYKFFYTALNKIIKLPEFNQVGKPYEIPRTQEKQIIESSEWRNSIPSKPKKKPSLWQRFKNWILFPMGQMDTKFLEKHTRNHEDQEESEEHLTEEIDSLEEEFTPL